MRPEAATERSIASSRKWLRSISGLFSWHLMATLHWNQSSIAIRKDTSKCFKHPPVCIYKNVRAPAISPRMASTNGHPMCSPHTSHRGLHSLSLIGTPVRSFCNSNPWIITTFLIRGGAWWCPKDTVKKKMGPVKSILSLSLSLSIIMIYFTYIGLVVDLPLWTYYSVGMIIPNIWET